MSDLPYILSDELKTRLHVLGWYENRQVEIKHDVEKARQNGWCIFPVAQAFLEQFDGLGLVHGTAISLRQVSGIQKDDDSDDDISFSDLANNLGEYLYPIGTSCSIALIFITESGRFIEVFENEYQFYGNIPQESFECLIDIMSKGQLNEIQYSLQRSSEDRLSKPNKLNFANKMSNHHTTSRRNNDSG